MQFQLGISTVLTIESFTLKGVFCQDLQAFIEFLAYTLATLRYISPQATSQILRLALITNHSELI